MIGLDAVKAATWDLHNRAERTGVIADIVAGRASRFEVALLLRGLLPVYQVLDPSVFGGAVLARASAIEADLLVLAPGLEVPLLPEGAAYADRVRESGAAMVAHAYVRYLGDLNGGPLLQRRLVASLGQAVAQLSFFGHPGIADRAAFTSSYRAELDRVVRAGPLPPIVQEAAVAFEMTIALSQATRRAAA